MRVMFNSFSRGFFSTLGRVLAYLAIGVLISFFFFSKSAKAVLLDNFGFVGFPLNHSEMTVTGSKTGPIFGNLSYENVSTNGSSFVFVDLCTTGPEPTLWITGQAYGKVTSSSKWYKVDTPCYVGGQYGNVFRQILYINLAILKQNAAVDGKDAAYFEVTGQLFPNTSVPTPMMLMRFGASDTVPLDDLKYENGLTQTEVLKDILAMLQSSSDRETEAIKEQTQKIEEQIKEQEKTNDLISSDDVTGANDSANSFFNDFDNNDYGLADIVKIPLQFINNITSATCSPLQIPLPFVDTDLTLPCMYDIYQTHFGSILTIYQTITFGMIAYYIVLDIFRMIKNFKDPDNDEIGVLEL